MLRLQYLGVKQGFIAVAMISVVRFPVFGSLFQGFRLPPEVVLCVNYLLIGKSVQCCGFFFVNEGISLNREETT